MTQAQLASYLGFAASVIFALIQASRDAWYFAPDSYKAAAVRWLAFRCQRASVALSRCSQWFFQLGQQLDKLAHDLDQRDKGHETNR